MNEPIKAKILRSRAASNLQNHVDTIKAALGHANLDFEFLLRAGDQLATELSELNADYIAALPEPDATTEVAYTGLVTKYDPLLVAWVSINNELSMAKSQAQPAATPPSTRAASVTANTKKPDRPEIKLGISDASWAFFKEEWTFYKTRASLLKGEDIIAELWLCCSEQVRRQIFDFSGQTDLRSMDESSLLSLIESSAVEGKNVAVHRSEFHHLSQAAGQRLHEYVATLKSKAEMCKFSSACPKCSTAVSYSEDMVSDQMVVGVADNDVQGEVLAKSSTLTTLKLRYDYMLAMESGKQSRSEIHARSSTLTPTPDPQNSAVGSTYRRQKNAQRTGDSTQQRPPGSHRSTVTCFGCGGHIHAKNLHEHVTARRTKCPARNSTCEKCHQRGHYSNQCQPRSPVLSAVMSPDSMASESYQPSQPIAESSIFAVESTPGLAATTSSSDASPHVEWHSPSRRFQPSPPTPPPILEVQLSILQACHEDRGRFQPRRPMRATGVLFRAIADTGAQTCTAGPDLLEALQMPKGYLVETSHASVGIDRTKLAYLGCAFLEITAAGRTTRQAVYLTRGVRGLYLSKKAQVDLGLVPPDFPTPPTQVAATATAITKDGINTKQNHATEPIATCGCLHRSKPPPKPSHLPFPPTPDNRVKLEQWLLQRYASSGFNTCEHQPLPRMAGRPLDIHFKESHEPKAFHTPIPVPHHWKEKVKEGLDRDVRIGTIETVPQGTPVTWCSRMVVVAKHDGNPRRTVDLQQLNVATERETHHTPSPYNQVSVVPPGTKKTVLDAWNGYHSLALSASARDATTFITEWGRYRYLRAPQGFHAAGDGYTRRYDDITVDVPRKAKCIDDTLLWDADMENSFWHTIDYIDLCSSNGIVFNPKKFRFAADVVDYAGFTITPDGIKPCKETIESITNFPTPTNLTDIRAWFGLINQVSYAIATSPTMEPFRDLLKEDSKWYWDATLEDLFELTKHQIAKQVEHGVQTFETTRPTCVATDWSKSGMGFVLLQKHCLCPIDKAPNCCPTGWRLVLTGSRFTNPAESRYAPIEGEALAIVEALDKCRMFVLGCPEVIVATDHKPLLKIFGDRALGDIKNPRLLRLKERSLRYIFTTTHVPGGWHAGPDALSRYPPAKSKRPLHISNTDVETFVESAAVAALHGQDTVEGLRAITWDRVKSAALADRTFRQLAQAINDGLPDDKAALHPDLVPYWNVRELLSMVEGVPLVGRRVVIPAALRAEVLDALHAAHQGVQGMRDRAKKCVYWPNINNAIQQRRDKCAPCNGMAPSQTAEPLRLTPEPDYPFQQVCADYFSYAGHQYLVYVDRYTSWINVIQSAGDCTAATLVTNLRTLFATYGIPEGLSTDGGPQFTSHTVRSFLRQWGVNLRLSSAYYAQSNGRAEAAVKTAKRLIMDNTGPQGRLDTDRVMAALLEQRNTPIQDVGLSPAQLLFGRELRDALPLHEQALRIRPEWKKLLDDREYALAKRNIRAKERFDAHVRPLPSLRLGDHVLVQNQTGNHPKRWDKTGVVVDTGDHRQYSVRMDGSGRHTLRNRRFLRKVTPMLADLPKRAVTELAKPPPTHGAQPFTIVEPATPAQTSSPAPSLPDQQPDDRREPDIDKVAPGERNSQAPARRTSALSLPDTDPVLPPGPIPIMVPTYEAEIPAGGRPNRLKKLHPKYQDYVMD